MAYFYTISINMCSLIAIQHIQVWSVRRALLQCRIKLVYHAQNELLDLLELLFN
jgi:hypothetical protein